MRRIFAIPVSVFEDRIEDGVVRVVQLDRDLAHRVKVITRLVVPPDLCQIVEASSQVRILRVALVKAQAFGANLQQARTQKHRWLHTCKQIVLAA